MVHVFRLGPLDVGGREAFAYAALGEDGPLVPPEVEYSDAKGLGALAKRLAGQELRCEPALAKAAQRLGLETAPLPRWALIPRATLAFGLALGPVGGRPTLEVLLRFFEACARFWKSEPWNLIDSDDPVPVSVRDGSRERRVEAAVMGGGGAEFGLALYDAVGSIRRVAELVEKGRMKEAGGVASIAVTFDEEPAWAAGAFEDAFSLPRLPLPMRVRKNKGAAPSAEELLDLAVVLEAVAALSAGEEDEATVRVEAAGRAVSATVSFPEVIEPDIDDELAEPMLIPEPLPATGRSRTPRNAPCPCGSGRKYKKCHLAEDKQREADARGTGPEAQKARAEQRRLADRDPVHALDERINADALALARRRWGRAYDPESVLAKAGLDFAAGQALLGWRAAHYRGPDGRTALDLYVEERGGALDEAGRKLVESERASWFSLHEVISADPGQSITLRDLLAGTEHTVQEKSASRTVRARDVLLARVVDLGDRSILAGCHMRSLPPREAEDARRRIRTHLGLRAAKAKPERLREASSDVRLFQIWQEVVGASDARPAPRLQNTDGEDLVLTVDRFEIAPGKGDEVLDGILDLPDSRRDEDEGTGSDRVTVEFVKEGNAKGMLPTTLVGRATIEGRALRLETNSRERADRLRALVTARLAASLSFRVREHAAPMSSAESPPRRQPTTSPEPVPPEVREVVRRMQVEYYQRWLDEEIPALGGLTPREAAARKGSPRKRLDLLLAEIEHHEAGQPEAQRFDVSVLRSALGLEKPARR
jgi:hypothetical protein